MWGNSFQPSSTSFLMNGNIKQYDLSAMFGEVRDKSEYQSTIHPTYSFLPLHRFATGILGGLRQLNTSDKPNNLMSYMTEKGLSPHLFNFISDPYRPKHELYDSSIMLSESKFLNPVIESVLSELFNVNQKTEAMKKEKVCNSQKMEMTVDVNHLPAKGKSTVMKENCGISPTMRLNIELAHRKTKEISKRSKRRRRRQKKNEQLIISNSTSPSASSDDDVDNECVSPVTDNVCFLSKSPDFECTLSVTHTVQLSPRNSFLIPVISDCDDDSEWETFDEREISVASNVSSSETDTNSSSNSSPIKCENLKSSSFMPVDCSVHLSSIISFVVPEDDSDDDSDWDTCETSTFLENTDFELPGLYFNNLCMPQSYNKNECNAEIMFKEDPEDRLQQRTVILEANNKWNELDDGKKYKTATKVLSQYFMFHFFIFCYYFFKCDEACLKLLEF